MRAGMPPPARVPGAQGLQEHQRLALVVHRAAGDVAFAARAIDVLRIERIAVPQRHGIDRLHVVMAVEQDVRAFVVRRSGQMPDDDGMARGGADGGLESQAGQLIAPPLGGLDAIRGVGRLRADRLDAQQVEQRCRARPPGWHRRDPGQRRWSMGRGPAWSFLRGRMSISA